MSASSKYGRGVSKDRTYRAHKRHAKRHFKLRWKNRLSGLQMPDFDLLRNEIQKAVDGLGSEFFTVWSRRDNSTRVYAKMSGMELIITYDHVLRVPVTVWEKRDYDDTYADRYAQADTI